MNRNLQAPASCLMKTVTTMRSTISILLILVSFLVPANHLAADTVVLGRWSVEKANDWYEQQPWLVGCNFTPSTAINQLEMWQAETFDPTTIDRELGWAAALGMNTARVYLHDLLWKQDPEGFLERIEQFLVISDKHGIRPMFVFFDACWNPDPELGKQRDPKPRVHNSGWVQSPHLDIAKDVSLHASLEPYVTGVITHFKDDSRILAWDLYNEPGNSAEKNGLLPRTQRAVNAILLEHAFHWARAVNPSQPLTAGVWYDDWVGPYSTRINDFMLANSDIISFHDYRDLEHTIERVGSIKPFRRPLLCTEYMARGAGSTFETHLPYFKKHKIAAYNWGLVAGKSQTQYPWSSATKKFTAEPELWHHDILRPDGTPFSEKEAELIRELTGEP